PLALARLGGDFQFQLGAFSRTIRLAQRQEAERVAAAQIDEGAVQPRRQPRHPPHDARAQAMFGAIVLSMNNQRLGATGAERHASGLARSRVQEDLYIGHQAASPRQPAPRRRFAASYRGRPMTAGWLPTIRVMNAAARPWMP